MKYTNHIKFSAGLSSRKSKSNLSIARSKNTLTWLRKDFLNYAYKGLQPKSLTASTRPKQDLRVSRQIVKTQSKKRGHRIRIKIAQFRLLSKFLQTSSLSARARAAKSSQLHETLLISVFT